MRGAVRGEVLTAGVGHCRYTRHFALLFTCRDPTAYGDIPPAPSDEEEMLGGGRVLAAWQGAQV